MRIAFFAIEDPATGPTSGIWSYIETMAGALQDLGHIPTVIIPTNVSGRERHRRGFEMIRLAVHPGMRRLPFPIGRGASSIAMARQLRRAVDQETLDIIESPDVLGMSAAIAGGRAPVIVRLHAIGADREARNAPPGLRSRLSRLLIARTEDRACRMASGISAPSSFALQAAHENGTLQKPHRVISNPVREVFFGAQRSPSPSPLIVFAGWLTRPKGIEIAVGMMPKILQARPDATLVLAGAHSPSLPNSETNLRNLLKQAPREVALHTECVGQLPPEELRKLFSRATVAVFPSRFETFGLTCAEAMAAGCPVVVSEGTALAELANGSGGGVVVTRTAEAFATAVIHLLSDTKLANRLSARARVYASRRFAPLELAAQAVDFYREVIAGA